jgi:hypothetical protein
MLSLRTPGRIASANFSESARTGGFAITSQSKEPRDEHE